VTALRVVLDTNLLVSYLLTQGMTISRIIDSWENGDIAVLCSPAIFEELVEVVQRPRLRQHMTASPQALIDLLLAEAIQTPGKLTMAGANRDPKDDKFLECALEGEADYIVTGDEDLLTLTQFHGIPIVRPFDFVKMLDANQKEMDV
jgi:putative PIN family toxin of toxin-antitoxin system